MNAEVLAQGGLEPAAGEVLVGEQYLTGTDQPVVVFEQGLHDLPLAYLGVGQAPSDGHALGGADQVEPEAPEVAGVAGAEAVAGVPARSERRTVSREAAHGSGVESTSRS